jgi:hypothetical protein
VPRHSSWHADELEQMVLRDIERWGQRIKKRLRPVLGDSVAEEIADAERDFNRAVRMVASAYGTLQDLAPPLQRLEDARAGLASVSDQKSSPDVDRLLTDAHSKDMSVAKSAVSALVERIIVGDEIVEVIPRF